MKNNSENTQIKILSQGRNFWRVEALFTDIASDVTDITERLQEVKSQVALKFGVATHLLKYTETIHREKTPDGLLVEIRIDKSDVPSGRPVIRIFPVRAPDGTVFSAMKVEADLFPYDEFDRLISRSIIEMHLNRKRVDLRCVNWDAVAEAISEMTLDSKPVQGLLIAEGEMPDLGKSSQITYTVTSDHEKFLNSAWIGVRPVSNGDHLVEASPAIPGLKTGRNVLGTELEPRQGIDTRLVAGEGVRASVQKRRLISASDGMLLFRRKGRDRRYIDRIHETPTVLTAEVAPTIVFQESQVFDLDLYDCACFYADIQANSRIQSQGALFIQGDIKQGTKIVCADSVRILGSVHKADISAEGHLCLVGNAADAVLRARLTLQTDGVLTDTSAIGMDVIAKSVDGGTVEALNPCILDSDSGEMHSPASLSMNIRRFLEDQQKMNKAAIHEIQQSLQRISDLFGPDVVQRVEEGSVQRVLLDWLRIHKESSAKQFSYKDVQELRMILELIPELRQRLAAVGMELQDITRQLHEER